MNFYEVTTLLIICNLAQNAEGQALFFRNDVPKTINNDNTRLSRQAQTDLTVRTIIDWLQGKYSNTASKGQDTVPSNSEVERTYLPPGPGLQWPRPFQTPTSTTTVRPQSIEQQPLPSYPLLPEPQPPFIEEPGTAPETGTYLPPNTDNNPSLPSQTIIPTEENMVPTGPSNVAETNENIGSNDGNFNQDTNIISDVGPSEEDKIGSGADFSGNTERPGDISSTVGGTDQQDISGGTVPQDESHPPHIHSIDVECRKDEMAINIEFDRPFNGEIYSKGYYRKPECRYVSQNSGQTKYSFSVKVDDNCGTQYVDRFYQDGQSFMENTLVIQNEPGIQEVWDTARRVRCLWEEVLQKNLNTNLNIDTLQPINESFIHREGKTRLEIQVGEGPFAPPANGIVKIGETMTLVVYVEEDPRFDVQVQQCLARDNKSEQIIKLTDERGCVLKPKLFGAFQKTRDTGSSSASVIAYAFFRAFKFPDMMDMIFECNVDLCKTSCEGCPVAGQNINPLSRRRRDLRSENSTNSEPLRVSRTFRVISPDDIADLEAFSGPGSTVINIGSHAEGICMSMSGFLVASILLLAVLFTFCLTTVYLWLKQQRRPHRLPTEKMWRMDAYHLSKS